MTTTRKPSAVGEDSSRSTKDTLALSPAFARAGAALAAYEMGSQVWAKYHSWYKERTNYRVSVDEFDPVFADVHDWLMSIIPDEEHRQLKVLTVERSRRSEPVSDFDDDSEGPPAHLPLRVVIDDASSHRLEIEGHDVKVSVSKPDQSAAQARSEYRQPQSINFEGRSSEAQRAIVRKIESLRKPVTARVPVLQMVSAWGSWRRRSDVPRRSLESVFLPAGQKEAIRDDIARFLADESRYNMLGMPYHRGYMLHGPPGTGKTSLAKAFATHFNLDLWYVPLGDLENEAGLMNLIAEVRPRSILLLEDIDTLSVATNRGEASNSSLNTGSLLNALDGVATPHGLITFMTTNHFGLLDVAITRAGRMDRIEEIGLPDKGTVGDMFRYFYGVPVYNVGVGLSQAEIAEVFKRHLNDVHGAIAELEAKSPVVDSVP